MRGSSSLVFLGSGCVRLRFCRRASLARIRDDACICERRVHMVRVYDCALLLWVGGVCEIVPTGCEKHETTNRAPVSVRLFFARRVVRCCASMFFSSLCRYRVERAVRSTCVHTNRRMDDVVPLVFRIENAVRSDVLFVL